jgi:hypothetical protein
VPLAAPAEDLATVLARLVARYRGWSPPAWDAPGRLAAAQGLAVRLAELGRLAGVPVPVGAVPMTARAHGQADQLTVLARDLVAALADRPDPAVAEAALLAARAAFP